MRFAGLSTSLSRHGWTIVRALDANPEIESQPQARHRTDRRFRDVNSASTKQQGKRTNNHRWPARKVGTSRVDVAARVQRAERISLTT
jgi:hypothetical protein